MFGGPNENEITLHEGLANIEKLMNCVVFGFIGIRILPGTGIFERAVEDAVIDAHESLLAPQFYYSPEISREKIEKSLKSSFDGRIDRIYPCHQFDARITMLHGSGHVGPLWNLILRKGRQ